MNTLLRPMPAHAGPRPLSAALRAAMTLSLAATLAACGGGDAPSADTAGAAALQAPPSPEPSGRAQALAATLPPLQPAPSVAPASGNLRCTNQQFVGGTVDNVEVPAGAACRLAGTVVRGSIQVAPGALLLATDVQVAGNVQGDQAAHVGLVGSATRVAGSVQLEGGGGALVSGARVGGDIAASGLGDLVRLLGNTVGGNLQLQDGSGGAELSGNRITGNLQCSGNAPAPLVAGNTAAALEGQCRPGGGAGGGTGGSGAPAPTPPLSGNVRCDGLTIGAIRLDTVTVPPGARCALLGTQLQGNLEIGAAATLVADGIAVTGGVVADGAAEVAIGGVSRVGGSVQLKQGLGAALAGLTVTGDLQIDAMEGPVAAVDNRIGGNLQAMANRGGVALLGNRVSGAMQCKDNQPAPTGRGNTAAQKQDQCRAL